MPNVNPFFGLIRISFCSLKSCQTDLAWLFMMAEGQTEGQKVKFIKSDNRRIRRQAGEWTEGRA